MSAKKTIITISSIIGILVVAFLVKNKLQERAFAKKCSKEGGILEGKFTCNMLK